MRRAISPRFAMSSDVITAGTPRSPRAPSTGPLWHADRAMATTVRVSRGSMTPSSATRPVAYRAERLGLGEVLHRLGDGRLDLLVDRLAAAGRLLAPDDGHDPGHLLGAHDGDLGRRPQEHEPGVEGPAAHAVVAGPVAGAQDHRDVGHRRVRQGVDHLAAVLDDPAPLVVAAHHVPGDVLQEQQRRTGLVAQLDELGGLLGRSRRTARRCWRGCRRGTRGSGPSR